MVILLAVHRFEFDQNGYSRLQHCFCCKMILVSARMTIQPSGQLADRLYECPNTYAHSTNGCPKRCGAVRKSTLAARSFVFANTKLKMKGSGSVLAKELLDELAN